MGGFLVVDVLVRHEVCPQIADRSGSYGSSALPFGLHGGAPCPGIGSFFGVVVEFGLVDIATRVLESALVGRRVTFEWDRWVKVDTEVVGTQLGERDAAVLGVMPLGAAVAESGKNLGAPNEAALRRLLDLKPNFASTVRGAVYLELDDGVLL